MLTGEFVYDYPRGSDPIKAILEDRVVPISKRRKIPKRLAAIIDKATSPKPRDRYPTASEMKKALETT